MNNLFSRCRNNTVVFSNNLVVAPRRSFFEGTSKFLRPSIKSEYHQASYISSSPLVALYQKEYSNSYERNWWQLTAILGGSILLIGTNDGAHSSKSRMTFCETEATTTSSLPQTSSELTPSSVAKVDLEAVVESHSMDDLPIYTADDVSKNDGTEGKPIWMSYGGIVYDVTNFINNHPGGSDKILQAAGTAIEPYWYLYRQHFNSDLPMRLMERMAIGQLREEDQNDIDEQMIVLERDDPYVHEPKRNPSLKVHTDTPMNAEVPTKVLNESYITPNDLFYIRNHHPVPFLNEKQIREYRLQIDLSSIVPGAEEKTVSFTLDELKQMPKSDLIVTLQCSGNRRGGFNTVQRTSGTPWGTSMDLLLPALNCTETFFAKYDTNPIVPSRSRCCLHSEIHWREAA
jgi:cytochrome b involved in lipid metabolism